MLPPRGVVDDARRHRRWLLQCPRHRERRRPADYGWYRPLGWCLRVSRLDCRSSRLALDQRWWLRWRRWRRRRLQLQLWQMEPLLLLLAQLLARLLGLLLLLFL